MEQTTRRPGRLPTKDVLLQHRGDGWTYQRIADEYGVTRGAVHLALSRSNLIRKEQPDYSDRIPWRVPDKYRNANPLRMLRAAAAREQGQEMSQRRERELDAWLKGMNKKEEWAPLGWVVCFDPERWPDKGFHYLPRGPEDTWLVRR